MGKIVCDVCGTQYSDTADQCPICGCARTDFGAVPAEAAAETAHRSATRTKGGRFSKENVQKRNQSAEPKQAAPARQKAVRPAAVPQPRPAKPQPKPLPSQVEPDEPEIISPKRDMIVNILLVVVILALLAVGGFIFKEFVLPKDDAPAVPELTEAPSVTTEALPETTETTIPPVPCTDLSITENEVMLHMKGQSWLLNVTVLPEDTTDELVFTSSDPEIAYVGQDGRVTAVDEGEAVITISCGNLELRYRVICDFLLTGGEGIGETKPIDQLEQTQPAETATEPAATTAPTAPLKDVTLKVNLTDITFNAKGQGYTFKCTGLENTEITWTSENENIVTVKDGKALSVGHGNTHIIAQYGEQKVTILVRCTF